MPSHSTDISVFARSAELPGLLKTIADRAIELGITDHDAIRLRLIVEELFANTVIHGHRGDSNHVVTLSLHRTDSVSTLHYQDDAPAFNLLKISQKPVSSFDIGGQGIKLIRGMSKALRHERRGRVNFTEVDF